MNNPYSWPTAGFERADLEDVGALGNPQYLVERAHLRNPIHPIFRCSNFRSTDRKVYELMVPSLRLASMFITHEKLFSWWCSVLYGEVKLRENGIHKMIERFAPTAQDLRNARDALIEHADHVTFDWGWRGEDYAFCRRNLNNPYSMIDILIRDTFKRFLSDEYEHRIRPAQKKRFQFLFAIVICHELGHSVWQQRRSNESAATYFAIHGCGGGFVQGSNNFTNEYITPYFGWFTEPFIGHSSEPEAELGHSFENYLFGAKITPINSNLSCKGGLMSCVLLKDVDERRDWDAGRMIFTAIPMDYVNDILSEEGWARMNALGRQIWKVPKTRVTSIFPYAADLLSVEEQAIASRLGISRANQAASGRHSMHTDRRHRRHSRRSGK